MGRLVVTEFLSLDGVFEDPGGSEGTKHGGWQIPLAGQEAMQYKSEELKDADALLLGRVTYEGFAKAWPTIEGAGEFGKKMNSMPKYVVSTTLTADNLTWENSSLVEGDLVEEIHKLREQFDHDILVAGSGKLVRTLMDHDLVDRYRFMIHPVILGGSRRLFDGEDKKTMRLTDSRIFSSGTVLLEYRQIKENLPEAMNSKV
jgi:dihydrofolate reductase